ncbi:uncharacterized protein V6R79_018942 [Siganus canaliculatus]
MLWFLFWGRSARRRLDGSTCGVRAEAGSEAGDGLIRRSSRCQNTLSACLDDVNRKCRSGSRWAELLPELCTCSQHMIYADPRTHHSFVLILFLNSREKARVERAARAQYKCGTELTSNWTSPGGAHAACTCTCKRAHVSVHAALAPLAAATVEPSIMVTSPALPRYVNSVTSDPCLN